MLAVLLLLRPAGAVDQVNLSSDNLRFDPSTGLVELLSNAGGSYGPYHFHADEIIIQLEEGTERFSTPEEITMKPGGFTGCDLDQPHYIFEATTIEIYPGDYLLAYNVVFYEFDGRLPLFYWPVVYINLEEERSNIEFEYGYNNLRGWFGKLTYNYNLWDLPGQLYFDYYQKTGRAYGLRQHYVDTNNQEGYFYYYTQNNKEDVPDLFNWEASWFHQINWLEWDAEAAADYQDYDDRYFATANVNVSNRGDNTDAQLTGEYEQINYKESKDDDRQVAQTSANFSQDFGNNLSTSFKYDLELVDYLHREDRDRRQIDISANARKRFANGLSLRLDGRRQSVLRTEQRLRVEDEVSTEARHRWGRGWQSQLDFEYGRLQPPERDMLTRWQGSWEIGRRISKFRYNMILERQAPGFSDEEDQASFYRMPEFNLYYQPRGKLDYHFQAGRYYEDDSDVAALRGSVAANYSDRSRIGSRLTLRSEQSLKGFVYRSDTEMEVPGYLTYTSEISLAARLLDNWTWSNRYRFSAAQGETPFRFDRLKTEDVWDSKLEYRYRNTLFTLDSGYNLAGEEFLPLAASFSFYPKPVWKISLGTEYDLNERDFSKVLTLRSTYRGENLTATTRLNYDLNDFQVKTLNNDLEYELPGDYGWYLANRIEYSFEQEDEERLRQASLALNKRFHCRELRFRYDHIDREFTVSYHLDLFGGRGLLVGRSEEESLIFNLGPEENTQE